MKSSDQASPNSAETVVNEQIFGDATTPEPVAETPNRFIKPEHADFPPIIIMAVSNVCDMACIHCAHPVMKKSPGYRARYMDPELHTKVVEETRRYRDNLWVFRYAADGESLLHPRFIDFVEEAKAAEIGPVNLTTNGMSLTDEKMKRLLLAPIDLIDVSLDAYTKAAYEKIRKRGDFEKVTTNLERLIELRDALGSPTKIMTSIIRQSEALDEIDSFVAFWEQRVDEVLVRGLNIDLGVVEATETYFDDSITRWACPQFWKRVTINHDGDLRFCVEDWFNRGVVANVKDSTIREIWTGPLYERFRQLHRTGRWGEMNLCRPCMDWQHMRWDHGFEKAVQNVLGKK